MHAPYLMQRSWTRWFAVMRDISYVSAFFVRVTRDIAADAGIIITKLKEMSSLGDRKMGGNAGFLVLWIETFICRAKCCLLW